MKRKILKTLLLLAAGCLLAAPAAQAQSSGEPEKKWYANDDTPYGAWGEVRVVEHGSAAQAVREMQSRKKGSSITVSRVRIFFDNSQNARAGASSVVARFKELYPDIPVYVEYKSPSWKVTVGNCLTPEEVIILQGRIQRDFDIAFLVKEEISFSAFAE